MDRPLAEQILDRCVETLDGCWEFTGSIASTGYGVVNRKGKIHANHRVTYAYFRADIPEGLHVDHLCRNRVCCNPWHLEPVTCKVNIRRSVPRSCKRGHEMTEESTYRRPDNPDRRQCRACIKLRTRGAHRDVLGSTWSTGRRLTSYSDSTDTGSNAAGAAPRKVNQ